MFRKILIANRGEIACRVARTARRLGIRTVAVYSDADAHSLHVEMADEAYAIGPAPARDSYLNMQAVLDAARRSGAEAVHPGYGFLAENAAFAEAVAAAGIIFIGPPASAIRAMGGKSEAKALMQQTGVPLVPGYHGLDQSPAVLRQAADDIGYPVLIKASAGGGGKGMRVVHSADQLEDAVAGAKREAASAFGDDRVLIEKYLVKPRHVEIQVFADSHGGCVYLFERDCSIQRRHQKVLEEAPAPNLPSETRRRMGEAAVAAAQAIGYVGAGTVEFLLGSDGGFYFMEMNTRLQVEHPVTEFITGQDLVEWQFRVAAGDRLPLRQDQLTIEGHAIEVRLYAEDPRRDFLPQTGRLDHLRFPEAGSQVRIDSGVRAGDAISIHYDPMIAKLIVHGDSRDDAVRRLAGALDATEVAGLSTNLGLLRAIAGNPAFTAADLDTGFIAREWAALLPDGATPSSDAMILGALGVLLDRSEKAATAVAASADPFSPWGLADGWRLNESAAETLALAQDDAASEIGITYERYGYRLTLEGKTAAAAMERDEDGRLIAMLDDRRLTGTVVLRTQADGTELTVLTRGETVRLKLADPLASVEGAPAAGGRLTAPMPGKIVAVLTEPGTRVARGDKLIVLEAMKMEQTLLAPADGVVAAVNYVVGDQVEEGVELISFAEPA